MNSIKALASAAALAMALTAAPAMAQDAMQPAPFGDAQIQAFAVAFVEVDRINREFLPRLQEAAGTEEQRSIQEDAMTEMTEAVESVEGIDVESYNAIIEHAQADDALAERINGMIQAAAQ